LARDSNQIKLEKLEFECEEIQSKISTLESIVNTFKREIFGSLESDSTTNTKNGL
jgi:hypothetical protein